MGLFMQKTRFQALSSMLKYALLPVLAAIYPAFFHFANNTDLVHFSSVVQLCVLLIAIGLAVYLVQSLFNRGDFPAAALGALLVLIFFHTYGLAFDALRSRDLFQVEHYNFLPVWIFAAFYLAWAVAKFSTKLLIQLSNGILLVVSGLLLFNVIQVAPGVLAESKQASIREEIPVSTNVAARTGKPYPDIYYLVFDEAAGFEAMRQYWHNDKVDEFVAFLKSNGFYVAENSHSFTKSSMYERTLHFNYEQYPVPDPEEIFDLYNETMPQNRVMTFLKERGYTLIAYDEMRFYLTSLVPLPVDHLVEEPPNAYVGGDFFQLDDYKALVLESTVLRLFLRRGDQDPRILSHKNMILYTIENASSSQFPAPRFVYVHLMLPHVPFVFRENGEIQLEGGYGNWQKYLPNYQYFLNVARQMVGNIMAEADPNNPPVIIIQSDHGARNNVKDFNYSNGLQNYPNEYKSLIVNAIHLPNCQDAPLTQDLKPINTFPIVFNCYFDANIPIQ
jgi:hypothetical protein